MGHLDGCQFPNLDRIVISFFAFQTWIDIFILIDVLQLDDTPNTSAKKTIILFGVFIFNGNIRQPKIGEFRKEAVLFYVQPHSNHINNGMTAIAAELCQNLL